MRRIDRRIVIISALLFIIGLSYGLMRYLISLREEPESREMAEAKRYVKCDTVVYATIISPVEAEGRLRSHSETDIISEASGKILPGEVALRTGSTFRKGDLLFSIYQDEIRLALLSRKSQFKSGLANLLPDLAFDFPEQESILRDYFNNLDIESDFPEFPVITDEKLRIFLAGRNIISEYYNIKKDELQLKRHNKYAPYDGSFSEIYLEEGAYANTGGRVAHAIRTDLLEVEVPLERFHSEWVKQGDKVEVISDKSGRSFTGILNRKAGFVDETTQSQSVFIGVRNGSDNHLLSGEYVHVIFPGHPIPGSMEIPRNAVFNSDRVFVVVNGRLEKRKINILKINTTTLIFNGLNEGEILVVQPLINVMEGARVEVFGSGPEYNERSGMKKDGQASGIPN